MPGQHESLFTPANLAAAAQADNVSFCYSDGLYS